MGIPRLSAAKENIAAAVSQERRKLDGISIHLHHARVCPVIARINSEDEFHVSVLMKYYFLGIQYKTFIKTDRNTGQEYI